MAAMKKVPPNKYMLVSAKIPFISSISLSENPRFFKLCIESSTCNINLNFPRVIGVYIIETLTVLFCGDICKRS